MTDEVLVGPICRRQEVTEVPKVFAAEEIARTGVIVVEKNNTVRAFENVCPHAFARLDFANTPVAALDGYHILCNVHGAQFDPVSGVCTLGPCVGAKLTSLKVKEVEHDIYIVKRDV
ncbi:MAG: Rieske (2Fe-2S) protein [Gammaproteobacteria bacterium]|nr:Rieske (2Fe-2S) protein [Gammaproteobacteria bacterium]